MWLSELWILDMFTKESTIRATERSAEGNRTKNEFVGSEDAESATVCSIRVTLFFH